MTKLLSLSFLLLAAACQPKHDNPTPEPSGTTLDFRLYDAADGDQFNAALNAQVYYFPASWSDSALNTYFGDPATNENWTAQPRTNDEEFDFDNVVAGGYGWSADPGFVHLDLVDHQAGQRVVIIWTFTQARENCRRAYRQRFFIWDGLGENQVLKTDRFRAGL